MKIALVDVAVSVATFGGGCVVAMEGIRRSDPLDYPLVACVLSLVGIALCKYRKTAVGLPLLAFCLPGIGVMVLFFYEVVTDLMWTTKL